MEFDHADIFDDLKAIQRQFHHLVRTMPQSGCIFVVAIADQNVQDTLKMGSWPASIYWRTERMVC